MAGFYDVGKLVATLGMNTSPFMAGANAAQNKMRQLQNSMMMVGRATTRFITLPMAIAGGAAVKAQKDFENSMTKIIGLVGISRKTVEGWKEEIFSIARETGRGPRELGDALYFVTSAGFRGSEALDILHKSAQAAAGGLGETKDVADLVTSAMYAYRKSNLSATEALDAVIASVREGKVEVTDLINSMGKVFPIASKFGVSINEVGASFAAMTRSGTEADKASTHLRAILNQMMSPSQKVRKNLAGLAMGADEFQKTLMQDGLIVALTKLNTAIKGDPRAYAEIFQNIRALTGVLDLMGDNMDENIRIFERMKGASGELKKLFAEVQETTQFKLDKSLANLGITLIELGEILKDPVVKLLNQLTEWLQKVSKWLNGMSETQKQATLQLVGFVAVLGPAMLIISRVSMMIMALASSVGGLVIILGAALFAWSKYNQTMALSSKMASLDNDIRKRSAALMSDETNKIMQLYRVVKNESNAKEDRIAALKEMQQLAPTHFAHLDIEKDKLIAVTDAYEDYIAGAQLKNKLDAISQAQMDTRQSIMSLEGGQAPDQKLQEQILTRLQIFQYNYKRAQKKLSGMNVEEKLRYNQVMQDLNNAEIVDLTNYLTVLEGLWGDTYKEFREHQEMMAALRSQRGSEDRVETVTQEIDFSAGGGGYLFDLQQRIKEAQEDSLGITKAMLPAKMDLLRATQRELQIAGLMGDEFSEQQKAQNNITILTIKQQTAGKKLWLIYENIKKAIQKSLDYEKLREGGLGAAEELGWKIYEAQEKLTNATEEERAAIKETLSLLYEKEDVMNEIVSKYAESQNLATQGTRLWRDHYTSRIADLTRWMAEENHTQQQYMSWADEKKQKEHELARQKFDLTAQSLQGVASLMGSLSTLQNNQMAAELKAAGKNEKLKAQISKKYFEKEKRNAIAQAIINGALAVTNILATVAGSALNPAAWLGIAIAAATTAAQIGVISAQSFAKGGLVYGETIAKVGDYPGASSNPEVIAPLSDLKGLLMTQDQREGKVVFEIEGRTLVGVLQREEKLINSY